MLRSDWSPPAIFLVLLMAIGSVCMWLALPLGLVYVASKVSSSSQVTFGSILIVLIGLPLGMGVIGKCLGVVNRAHGRLTGRPQERYRASWTKSMRGERGSTRRAGVLDKVMVVSVSLALVAAAIWFFGFAGSSLPQ